MCVANFIDLYTSIINHNYSGTYVRKPPVRCNVWILVYFVKSIG